MIDIRVFCGNLYILELFVLPFVSTTLYVNPFNNMKRLRLNEKSSILWNKRLDLFPKQKMKRLINDEILSNLDFSDFDTWVDCIKGKLATKIRNVKADRCTELLRVIHTNICGPFTPPVMGDHKYFITFIDDYSHYGFVELICEKYDYLEAFNAFKEKFEL